MTDPSAGKRTALALLGWAIVFAAFVAAWLGAGIERLDRLELPVARAFNAVVGGNETLDRVLMFFNRKPGEALSVAIIFAAFVLLARCCGKLGWKAIALAALGIFVVWIVCNEISDLLERAITRDAPAEYLKETGEHHDLAKIYGASIKTSSTHCFPSNHGTVFFTVLFMCWFRFGKKALWLVPLVIVLDTPRVFGGAHWLSDGLIGSPLVVWPVAAVADWGRCAWAARRTRVAAPG